ncbi:MAG: glycosyltransferase [Rhodomicrobium sp.]
MQAVDEWVWDFMPYAPPAPLTTRAGRFLVRNLSRYLGANSPPDQYFRPDWLSEAAKLQAKGRYSRVIVSYAFHSKFLKAFPAALKLVDTHDVFANRRGKLKEKGIKDYWYTLSPAQELVALKRADRILAIQDEDAEHFRGLLGNSNVYRVGWEPLSVAGTGDPGGSVIGYLATGIGTNLHSIVWFIEHVWSRLHTQRPRARLLVGGEVSRRLPDCPGMEKLGIVNDLREFYEKIDIAINPMLAGTGLKIKTLEAIAHYRCVVATPVGAAGLGAFNGRGIFICDKADEFVSTLKMLLDEPARLRRAAEDGQVVLSEMRAASVRNLNAALTL